MLDDGQISLRGLVMGKGTPYELMDFNPWVRSVRAPSQTARAWDHGDWSGAEWTEAAVVPWRVCLSAVPDDPTCGNRGDFDTWISRRHALSAALAAAGDDTESVEMRFRFGSNEYLMFGRPRLVSPDTPWIRWVPPGSVVTSCAFIALDPLIYSGSGGPDDDGLMCTELTLSETTGGLRFPVRFPVRFGATQTGNSSDPITNLGTAPTGLQIRINGPIDYPRISLTSGPGQVQRLQANLILSAGQWLDIDTAARTVLLNGTASRRGQVYGTFPVLPPGTHEVSLSAESYNADATANVCWRSAWY